MCVKKGIPAFSSLGGDPLIRFVNDNDFVYFAFAPSYMARFRFNSFSRQICFNKNQKCYAFEVIARFSARLVFCWLF